MTIYGGFEMRERLESVGVKPGMAALIDAMITINCGGPVHNLTKELNLCAGYFMSVATKLEKPPLNVRVTKICESLANLRNGGEVIDLPQDEYEELNTAQENAVEELTKIPEQFNRRETAVGNNRDQDYPVAPDSYHDEGFYKDWDDVELDARIEELAECNDLSGAQWSELANLEQEQDRRREDADPDDDSDVDGGQPAILKPEPSVNPKGPAPAVAVPLDSDLDLILTV